jgi:hypothetical protein
MATPTTTMTTHKIAQRYYCSNAITDACRIGFGSLSAYSRHKRNVHTAPNQLGTGPKQDVQGAYFQKHPVIDGVA